MSKAPSKLGKILFVMDERLSREKSSLLARRIALLKQFADVQTLPGNVTEDELLGRLKELNAQLVIVPWYRYLGWSRVEAYYGLTRTSGPTFAGYFCEPVLPYEIGETADHLRAILLDFSSTQAADIVKIVSSLIQDRRRTGITPLLESGTPVYYENWYSGQGLGLRMDAVMALPEVALGQFSARGNAIRLCLNALWSLVYESGPGKGDFSRSRGTSMPKAYFQVGADRRMLLLRLIYSVGGWSPKDVLAAFWPKPRKSISPAQIIQSTADTLRIHWIAESSDLEITIGFNAALESEPSMDHLRTLWIEPVTTNIMSEIPFEVTGPSAPHLKTLPYPAQSTSPNGAQPVSKTTSITGLSDEHQERLLIEAVGKIRDLKRQLAERDDQLRELRAGGIGTAPPLPPPDMDGLIDAFRERVTDAGRQLKQLEVQIAFIGQARDTGHRDKELEALNARLTAMLSRQQGWVEKIAEIIEALRKLKASDHTNALKKAKGA